VYSSALVQHRAPERCTKPLLRRVHLGRDEGEPQPPDGEPRVGADHARVLVARGAVVAAAECRFGVEVGGQRLGAAVRERHVGARREFRIELRPHAIHHVRLVRSHAAGGRAGTPGAAAFVQRGGERYRRPAEGHAALDEEARAQPPGEIAGLRGRGRLRPDLRDHAPEGHDLDDALHRPEAGDEVLGELGGRVGRRAEHRERHHGEARRRLGRRRGGSPQDARDAGRDDDDRGGAGPAPTWRLGARECGEPGARRSRALAGPLGERGDERTGFAPGDLRAGGPERAGERGGIRAEIGRRAGECLECDGAEGVEIGAAVHVPARRLLGSHVPGRPDEGSGLRERAVPRALHPGDAEVGEQGAPAVFVEQDVRRLHVPVHDAAPVGVAERVGDLADNAEDRVGGETRVAPQPLLQGHAAHERHDEEGDPVAGVEIVHADDVGVVERGAERGLAAEALVPHPAGGHLGGEHLHSHDVTERAMAGAEDGAHAADAGEAQHFVPVADGALDVCESGGLHAGGECSRACWAPHRAR